MTTAPDVRPLSVPLTTLLGPGADRVAGLPAAALAQAACAAAGQDPEDWFPFPTDDYSHAAAVCAGCPIREACGAWGRANRMSGVWGGLRLENGRVR
ncbi:MAG: WhiB family transcriptional regulator [Gordonia sp. (in: high G+C Gram-positive bacteria)]